MMVFIIIVLFILIRKSELDTQSINDMSIIVYVF